MAGKNQPTFFERGCIRLTCGFGNNPVLGAIIGEYKVFTQLKEVERGKMGAVLKQQKYRDGQVVIKDDEIGDGWYAIRKGKAKVFKKDPSTRIKTEKAILGKGDFFGEVAQMLNVARGGEVVAYGALTVWFLSKEKADKLFKQNQNSAIGRLHPKRQVVVAETGNRAAPKSKKKKDSLFDTSSFKSKPGKKTPEVKELLLQAIGKNELLSRLTKEQKDIIINLMHAHQVAKGVTVIRKGEEGAHMYVITKGEFEMVSSASSYDDEKKATETVKKLTAGQSFGDLALMHATSRHFTIKALGSNNTIYSIDRVAFRGVLASAASHELSKIVDFLKGVNYLQPLSEGELMKIAERIKEEEYIEDQVIISNGQEPDSLYIITDGEVVMTEYNDKDEPVGITTLRKGDFFGEDALLKQKKKSMKWIRKSVQCKAPVKCLKLLPETFEMFSDKVEELLRKRMQLRISSPPPVMSTQISIVEDEKKDDEWGPGRGKDNIKFENLKILGFLGKGSYGHVQLVQDRTTKATYALKGVMKKEVVECNQVEHIVSEKKVMMLFDTPFILKLHATYNDKDCVYFLLEPSLGGELFNVLRARTILDEYTASYYVASVILAFNYMHSMNVVYRDLKPENILLDSKGHAKVADFGFAKKLCAEEGYRTFTLCGTPDYLAPEVIMGEGHGFGFDWWCIGIFIYELLAGWPPFMDQEGDVMKTYENIVNMKIQFPEHISNNAVNIMAEFLQHKASDRLGMTNSGLDGIKENTWFNDLNWDGLIDGSLKPPVNPKVGNIKDLSNFDDPEDGRVDRDVEEYEPMYGEDRSWEDEF